MEWDDGYEERLALRADIEAAEARAGVAKAEAAKARAEAPLECDGG